MKTIFAFLLITISLNAQERVLLRIDKNGNQEAIPLKKGERAQDLISRMHNESASLINGINGSVGLIDTLKYYSNDGMPTNFGFTHQDVAFQWFMPAAGGRVKEFWWYNYQNRGVIKQGTIRAWIVNPKLATRPTSVVTKFLGHYKDPDDGDGLVTPFKPASGNTWFYGNGSADSSTWNFDPLGTEVATWIPGGESFSLDSIKWQGIRIEDYGDSMFVNLGQLFGFTISNDTRLSDILPGGTDTRMEILADANANSAPHHSYKWYETGRTGATDKGWHLRGDYNWLMYVIIEYTRDRPPKIVTNSYQTTLRTTPRLITATITDDNPSGGSAGVASAYLKFRKGTVTTYDSIAMTANGSTYTASIPGSLAGDIIFWFISAKDVNNNYTALTPRSYRIFKKTQCRLFIFNSAIFFSMNGIAYYYTNKSSGYDHWSTPFDGTEELPDLLALYNSALLVDASYPSRNVYPEVKKWCESGTNQNYKALFFTSQDYGCFINSACADTSFSSDSFEGKFLGISKLGPQDIGPTDKPFKIIPLPSLYYSFVNYLIKYNKDSATTLWHHPTYELGFPGYPDAITPIEKAIPIFSDGSGSKIMGVVNRTATCISVFLPFDAGALQFRSDTSLQVSKDPKYQWIADIGSIANEFFYGACGPDAVEYGIQKANFTFSLNQNYPNPFNPVTTIQYEIPSREFVKIVLYNSLGQQVSTVVNELKDPGSYTVTFNARSLSSGIYFYEMSAGSFVSVKKMLLMK